jgi:hypothetical protein
MIRRALGWAPAWGRDRRIRASMLRSNIFRTERVFAGILVIGVIGFTTDLGFCRLRRWLLPWYRETDNA